MELIGLYRIVGFIGVIGLIELIGLIVLIRVYRIQWINWVILDYWSNQIYGMLSDQTDERRASQIDSGKLAICDQCGDPGF